MHHLPPFGFARIAPLRVALLVLACLFLHAIPPVDSAHAQDTGEPDRVLMPTRTNVSVSLSSITVKSGTYRDEAYPFVIPNRFNELKFGDRKNEGASRGPDPVIDRGHGPVAKSHGSMPPVGVVGVNIEGASADDSADKARRVAPPDTNGDVGPDHYVQWINVVFEIFDKSGTSLLGPLPGNAFFAGMGGDCEARNDGDPIVLYDHLADRWMVSQFVSRAPYKLCIAVSTTPDPTGSYAQYEYDFGNDFPDYPKYGVWTDAYYGTIRTFSSSFKMQALALDRDKMLAGQPAPIVVRTVTEPGRIDGYLPADLDGPPPPVGTPGMIVGMNFSQQALKVYDFSVDWANPSAATLTLADALPVAPFTKQGFSGQVDQPGTPNRLDALGGFLMHRVQYRNFSTHQGLVLNHTVRVAPSSFLSGIRWYELRSTGGPWGIHQQGTFAPDDGLHRWMASIAMNGAGEIGLGYSVSGSTLFPSIRFAGQSAALSGSGMLDVAEVEIQAGGGSQTGSLSRWGDYSMMSVDPVDDATFWYTQEYYAASGTFDFSTRITSFTFESQALHADAGPDQSVVAGQTVSLDGTGSFGPPNNPITSYNWTVTDPGGAAVGLADGATSTPDFCAATVGNYAVELVVETATALSDPDGAQVTAVSLPVAVADLVAQVEALGPDGTGTLNKGLVRALTRKLTQGGSRWERDQTSASVGAFGAFRNQVESLVDEGVLSAAEAAPLLAGVQVLQTVIHAPCTPVAPAAVAAEAKRLERDTGSHALHAAYPNPVRQTALVRLEVATASAAVQVTLYDALGRRVGLLVDGTLARGVHTVPVDAMRLPSGTYFVRMTAGSFSQTRSLTVVR